MFVGYGAYNRNINNSYYAIFQNRKYSTVVVDGLPNGNAHPMLSTGSNQNDFQQSSWWIADGSFVKLQNAAVSYTLPKSWISPLKLKELKLSVYGTDLLKFSKIKDLDPESLDAGVTDYPLFSTLAVGLSITL
jgi:hypothetical protein